MRRALPFLLFVLAAAPPARAQTPAPPQTVLDVAPTTLDLQPDRAGLFFVTNHGARPITVQIEAMDWRQQDTGGPGRLTPSTVLLTSPPMARIAPGGRQSVRVLARGPAQRERAFRLLVSQLPDAADDGDGVHVLLQFSVPVFVGHSESINIEFHSPMDEQLAREILREAPGVAVVDKRENGGYITPIEVVGERLRDMMPWIKANKIVDRSRN